MKLELWMWVAFASVRHRHAPRRSARLQPARRADPDAPRGHLERRVDVARLRLRRIPLAVARRRAARASTWLGFLIEKSLSIDNLFVFALIFAYFGGARPFQRRVALLGHRRRDRPPRNLHPRRRRHARRLSLHDLPVRRLPRHHRPTPCPPPHRRDPPRAKPRAEADPPVPPHDQHLPGRQARRPRAREVRGDADARRTRPDRSLRRRLCRRLDPRHLRGHPRHASSSTPPTRSRCSALPPSTSSSRT